MSNRLKTILSNFSYTFLANMLSIFVSALVVLLVPKLLGSVVSYGYFQLFMFYASYVGFMHLGWNDGIYLRYGGYNYDDLDKKLFSTQFYLLVAFQIVIAIVVSVVVSVISLPAERQFIWKCTAIFMVIVNAKGMLAYVLQATNRMKENAISIIWDRTIYSVLIFSSLALGVRNYKVLIISDLIGRLVGLFVTIGFCSGIVKEVPNHKLSFAEAKGNIFTGSNLMFSGIASMLIIGVFRFGIEKNWGIETFGKVSLTLSISNMLLQAINAVGLVLFPMLKRVSENRLAVWLKNLRSLLLPIMFALLILYWPIRYFLDLWLPGYADSMKLMPLLFPISVYESQTALINNTFFKALRKERTLLAINLLTLLLSALSTLLTVFIMKNLVLAILSIVFVLACRSIIAERILEKYLGIKMNLMFIFEAFLTVAFISFAWFLTGWKSLLLYMILYSIYLIRNMSYMKESIVRMKYI